MEQKRISSKEELFNTISHGVGAFLFSIGLMLLLFKNTNKTDFATISIIIYGLTLVSMFVVSALYHAVSSDLLKRRLRILDHITCRWKRLDYFLHCLGNYSFWYFSKIIFHWKIRNNFIVIISGYGMAYSL